jgi:hypothetical protein
MAFSNIASSRRVAWRCVSELENSLETFGKPKTLKGLKRFFDNANSDAYNILQILADMQRHPVGMPAQIEINKLL